MEFLNDLINSGWSILENGFDLQTFLTWKQMSFACLVGLLGPLHFYAQNFNRFTSEHSPQGLLAAEGILAAAKEEIAKADGSVPGANNAIDADNARPADSG
ncbi:MAG: hypothetical protein ACLQPD_16565 [Desulfomonilaceae bacterium]